jgi:ribosomal protein L7/L12
MSNIKPNSPSFVFGYWRPWKEDSNLSDSYLDYLKDKTLLKYGADTVGKYINQASKEQVQAINQLGHTIGRGMKEQVQAINQLGITIERGMDILNEQMDFLSSQMTDINKTLVFINRNMDIQIEQQKLSNLLLQNITELLRVPDSEKERQHSIELGIKFFVNASKDGDLYADALEELLKAESLMKQDYFVLHRIGCIYLFVEKFLNPEKAFQYFVNAAKYASIESDNNAVRLLYSLNSSAVNHELILPKLDNVNYTKSEIIELVKDINNISLKESKDLVDNLVQSNTLKKEEVKIILQKCYNEAKNSKYSNSEKFTLSQNQIGLLASDSYEKAAFAAYVLGQFSDAVNYQSKALEINGIVQNRFVLAKYQARAGEIVSALSNLDKAIDENPYLFEAIAYLRELDLAGEPFLELLQKKNSEINSEIKSNIDSLRNSDFVESVQIIEKLNHLIDAPYTEKVLNFRQISNNLFKKIAELNSARKKLLEQRSKLLKSVKSNEFISFENTDEKNSLIQELVNSSNLSVENMQFVLTDLDKKIVKIIGIQNLKNQINKLLYNKDSFPINEFSFNEIINKLKHINSLSLEEMRLALANILYELESKKLKINPEIEKIKANSQFQVEKLKIGSKHEGGIIFYLDNSGNHGLVCTEIDLGKYNYGGIYKVIGAYGNGIADKTGNENTDKIYKRLEKLNLSMFLLPWRWLSIIKNIIFSKSFTAAGACVNAEINGYNDWYLPTLNELELVYKNLYKNNLGNFNKGSFSIPFYWSSTENNLLYAYYFNFANGTVSELGSKNTSMHVRAIRTF